MLTPAKKKLGKLSMPSKDASNLDMLGMHDESNPMDASAPEEGSDEEEANETPDQESAEGDDTASSDALTKASDDDLMAEVEKRGLVKKLEEEDAANGSDGHPSDDMSAEQGSDQDQEMYS